MKRKIYLILALLFLISGCDKHEKNNPFDPGTEVDWAPENVTATPISPYVMKIKWEISSTLIDGFKVDRKEESGSWVYDIADNLGNLSTSWNDYNCQPNRLYTYNVYSTAGTNSSQKVSASATTSGGNTHGTFTDSRDGKVYKWVKIGNQTWMAENLAYLPHVSPPGGDSGIWVYVYFGTNVVEARSNQYYQNFGGLYNWGNAMTGCAPEWHLPTKDEWNTLINNLGGHAIAGGKLKEAGGNFEGVPSSHWSYGSVGATNESGFFAVPGGFMSVSSFCCAGWWGIYWTSTKNTSGYPIAFSLTGGSDEIEESWGNNRSNGYSIRCLKN